MTWLLNVAEKVTDALWMLKAAPVWKPQFDKLADAQKNGTSRYAAQTCMHLVCLEKNQTLSAGSSRSLQTPQQARLAKPFYYSHDKLARLIEIGKQRHVLTIRSVLTVAADSHAMTTRLHATYA